MGEGKGPGARWGTQDSASYRMGMRPTKLGAEESARCPPSLPSPLLTCPSEFLGLHEVLWTHFSCLFMHLSDRLLAPMLQILPAILIIKPQILIQSSMFKECTITRECKEGWMLRNRSIFYIKRLKENNHLVICISFEKIKIKGYLILAEAFAFSLLPIPENQITTQIIKLLSLISSSHICT